MKEETNVAYNTPQKIKSYKIFTLKSKKGKMPIINSSITSSGTAYEILKANWSSDLDIRERFVVMVLNRQNRPIGQFEVSSGSVSGTSVDMKILFGFIVTCPGASSIIIAHNHPSGSEKPSKGDLNITERIKKACELMDVELLDHLILLPEDICYKKYVSFVEENYI